MVHGSRIQCHQKAQEEASQLDAPQGFYSRYPIKQVNKYTIIYLLTCTAEILTTLAITCLISLD